MLARVIARMFIMATTLAVTVCVQIYGWGLTPKSWWWIVGAGYFLNLFLWVMLSLVDVKK